MFCALAVRTTSTLISYSIINFVLIFKEGCNSFERLMSPPAVLLIHSDKQQDMKK